MSLHDDDFRRTIAARALAEPREMSSGHVALDITFDPPLSGAIRAAIGQESAHLEAILPTGFVSPDRLELGPTRARLWVHTLNPGAIRLDGLLGALAARGSPLGSAMSAALVATVAALLHELHEIPGIDGAARVHGNLGPHAVMLTPEGAVAVVGAGLPLLDELLSAGPAHAVDRLRFASKEAVRGEPLGPRADVYSLGALYYELLAGRPYRGALDANGLREAALAGRAPDLPGELPDPRPQLVALLARALAPNPSARPSSALELGEGVLAELAESGALPGAAELLAGLIRDYVPANVPRGPRLLVEAPTEAHSLPTEPARPASLGRPQAARPLTDDLVPPPPPPAPDPWASLLGEEGPASQKRDLGPSRDPAPSRDPRPPENDPAPWADPTSKKGEDAPLGYPRPPRDDLAPSGEARPSRNDLAPSGEARPPRNDLTPLGLKPLALPRLPDEAPKLPWRAADAPIPPGSVPRASSAAPGSAPRPDASSIAKLDLPGPTSRGASGALGRPSGKGPLGDLGLGSPSPATSPPDSKGTVLRLGALGLFLVAGLGIAYFALRPARVAPDPDFTAEPIGSKEEAPADAGLATAIAPPRPDASAQVVGLDTTAMGRPPPLAPSAASGSPSEPAIHRLGYLTVLSTPSGASVELDGGYVGVTPLVLRHEFESRPYQIRVLADGHVPWEREVWPDDELKSINLTMTLSKGR